ncbi:hypothetical protein yc1106_02814 [Curvularia clavata]|uniref:Uncharacterized protein n=1 Tax=Curvularia clavata TaxID=95742 RepID=A0A9Q8Z4I5_CURCL|nr:hypothetical protein yc1106_02814 [Curvularia clavata]
MSGILCAWANLPEEVAEWFKNTYLQNQRTIDCIHSIHCEVTASGMEHEPVGKLDAPWPYLTVHEVKDVKWANKQLEEAANNLPEEAKTGPLKHIHFDVRSYKEVKRWQDEDWEGMGGDGKKVSSDKAGPDLMPLDIEHVASIAAMEWTVAADKEEEVLKFYQETVGPTIASSPDVLRFRLFKIDCAMTIDKEQQCNFKDVQQLHKYFTLVELEGEEWPWDVVVDLAEEQGWKDYFETQQVVKWQLSHYLVDKTVTPQKQEASAS